MQKLNNSPEELILARKMRNEFISVASHELKTPVTALKLQVQMVKRMLENKATEPLSEQKIKKFIERADKDILRLSRLIEDMVESTTNIETKKDLNFLWFNLEEFIEGFVKSAKTCFPLFDERVHVKINAPVIVYWDHQKIEQLFLNLLSNAYRFGNCHIEMNIYAGADQAFISIKDDGPGISLENQVRIFEMFERDNSHGKSGLGLGLYVCKEILKSHGGEIELESLPGEGASFNLRIPLKN